MCGIMKMFGTSVRAFAGCADGQQGLQRSLYTIATNACLDALKKRPPRTLPVAAYPAADPLGSIAPATAEALWLEPFPDSWLTEATGNPEAH